MAESDSKPQLAEGSSLDQDNRTSSISNMDPERRKIVEKSLKRKLDARCSLFVLIYIMNYLDRNNIAAARLGGLQEDLNIDVSQNQRSAAIPRHL